MRTLFSIPSNLLLMGNNDNKPVKVVDQGLRMVVGLGSTIALSFGYWFANQVQHDAVSVSVLNQRVSAIEEQIPKQISELKADIRSDIRDLKLAIQHMEKRQ